MYRSLRADCGREVKLGEQLTERKSLLSSLRFQRFHRYAMYVDRG